MYFLLDVEENLVNEFLTKNHSHWTSRLAGLEEVPPFVLFATHRYCPLSALLTLNMINVLLSSPKLILESSLVLKMDSSLVHDIVGAGFPVALQDKVTLLPSIVVSF